MSYQPPPGDAPGPPGAPDPQQPQPYDQPGSPQPAYPYSQGYPPPYAQTQGTNLMAILSLVFAFVFAPVGIVLGHIAKKQIRQTGEQGDGIATAGLVLSYVFTGLALLACCGVIGLAIASGNNA